MLSRPRKAHNPCNQRVIATMGPLIPLSEQLIETV
jgi:hypothetical protein